MDHDCDDKLGEDTTASRKAGVSPTSPDESTNFCQKRIG